MLEAIKLCWKSLVLISVPLLLSPLLFYESEPLKCAYLVLVMAIYWSTEVVPVPVTALLPVVALPLLGILSTEDSCSPYMQEPNMVFVGSLIFAIGVESSKLHKRIALLILQCIGGSLESLMLGFMLTTMLVAMWIINTAAAAMMLPIADAILEEVFPEKELLSQIVPSEYALTRSNENNSEQASSSESLDMVDDDGVDNSQDSLSTKVEIKMKPQRVVMKKLTEENIVRLRKIFYLSIAYSANIGGTSTLTSNGPNLILRFVVDSTFIGAPLDYANWFLLNAPSAIVSVVAVWWCFRRMYLRNVQLPDTLRGTKSIIRQKYKELGSVTFAEGMVMTLFVSLVSLWMLRDPTFITGWATYFPDTKPRDATVAIFVAFMLFVLPTKPLGPYPSPSLLDWPTVHKKLAWGVIILRGGGFSLAKAVNKSGLSELMGLQFAKLSFMSTHGIIITFSVITAFLTEFASNSAVASVLLPICVQLAAILNTNPLLLLIPITLSCSMAFILPVGTPANALVFEHAKLVPRDMLVPGLVAQFVCLVIMLINVNTLGRVIFSLNEYPDWAALPSSTIGPLLNSTTTS